ncbi:MAG: cytochrome-c peroxidase [Capnocytophaga sp.]|nr:cytochrome-c peroxidase [Capnocytophaga sp.]
MKKYFFLAFIHFIFYSCKKENDYTSEIFTFNNPKIELKKPSYFPDFTEKTLENLPSKYGVELGKKLFYETRLSGNNTISCATCHIQQYAYADTNPQAIGIYNRKGLRNTPPIQNMAFLKYYMWDGAVTNLKEQPLIPIVTDEEMDSSVLRALNKIKDDPEYKILFQKNYEDGKINSYRMLECIAQYMLTLISDNSKYDKVIRKETTFSPLEQKGWDIFNQKCASCHSGALFTDQTFRNVGFPINPNIVEEAGRGRFTGKKEDFMKFRVPSLRNIEHTAPYGSFGQFATLRDVLDYFSNSVIDANNLDPILKNNGNKIPLSEEEKDALIAFMKTLTDKKFIGKE